MEKTNLNLNIKGNEIIIREGKAPIVEVPKGINIQGIITAPASWYAGKLNNKFDFDFKDSHVIVDRDEGEICLTIAESFERFRTTIKGKLQMFTDLLKFKINSSQTFSANQLSRFLKMNRAYFVDRDENQRIITNLQNFKATVTQELEQNNDLKGNKLYHFEQRIKNEFSLDFTLLIPIFKGFTARTFKVEILFDITDGSVNFWLESIELKEIFDKERNDIIDTQLSQLKPFTIVEI